VLGGTEESRRTYLEQMALVEPRCPSHYRHFIVAEVNGRAAAALCGYDPPLNSYAFGFEAMTKVDQKLGRNAAVAPESQAAFDYFATCAWKDPIEPGAWIIESVATLPGFRRRRLMTGLLEGILEEGRLHGCDFARVSVVINNTAAEELYKNAGFEVVDEKRTPQCEYVFGFPGLRLLKKLLL